MAKSAIARSLETARKRYRRYASRLEKEAESASGVTKQALESKADIIRKTALEFTVKNLRNKYGNEQLANAVTEALGESAFALQKTGRLQREESLGKVLISNDAIASRFYAGTIEIWRGLKGEARNAAIIEFFGVDNIYQAMELLTESTGKDLYAPANEKDDPRYISLKDAIKEEVAARLALG